LTPGISILNVEPLPTSESNDIAPPIASANWRQIARPKPVPPWREILEAVWTYGESILCLSSSLMPTPVSSTSSTNTPLVSSGLPRSNLARISTNPFSVNFTAFAARLNAMCLRRSGSTISCGISPTASRTSTPGLPAETRNDSPTSRTSARQSVGESEISVRPVSRRDRSRMSFTSARSVLLLTRIDSTAASLSSFVAQPNLSICEKPTMALSGVLMSWLIVEKKYAFAFAAAFSRRETTEYMLYIMPSATRTKAIWTRL